MITEPLRSEELEAVYSRVPGRIVHCAYRGSIAHGMHNPDPESIDDIDLMGVFIAPQGYYLGLDNCKDTVEIMEGRLDAVFYEYRKFLGLLLKQNPNVLSLLFTDEDKTLRTSSAFARISAPLVASKAAYPAFRGYAYAQMQKMTRHRDTPKRRKKIADLQEQLRAREAGEVKNTDGLPTLKKLRKDLNDILGTSGYMGTKRRKLVEKFGYDTKNAAHLLRLLRLGTEYLNTGGMTVDRRIAGDAEELLAVKNGEWSITKVRKDADIYFNLIDQAYEYSALPEEPDRAALSAITQNVLLGEFCG